jgi:toxin secretion/phage lysis holin|nr:MAG TPA: holin [Caudoviricetes sp.]
MKMKHLINDIVSVILTTFVYLVGGFDIAIQSLLIVMVVDYLTGITSAIYNKELSSKIGFKGILKKFSYLCVVALSVVIDNLTGQSGLIRTLVIYFFVANDGLSIIENMAEMGVKLPQKLIDSLEQIKKKGE